MINDSKKLNIVYINQLDERGGAANLAHALMYSIKQMGNDVSMFVGKKVSKDPSVYLIQKPFFISKFVKKITGRDIERFLKEKIYKIFPTDINFSNIRNLFESKEYKEADIVHCHNLHAGFFNLKAFQKISKEKKLIWTLHDMWAITYGTAHTYSDKIENGFYELPSNEKHPYYNDLVKNKKYLKNKKRQIYDKSHFHLVVPSVWLKNKVEKSLLGDKPIHLIHNGIDNKTFKRFDKKESREKLNLPLDKKIITFLADGGEANSGKGWKYVENIIDYFKEKPDIVFMCIGRRSSQKKQSGKKIIFIDYISDKKTLAEYYSASDIFLFTSIAENFPLVILEAMACGLPIVSFDVGGVKEAVIHNKNGYISKYCDVSDTIRGIESIQNLMEAERDKMSQDSIRRISENFSLDIMTEKYIELYKSLMKNQND